MALRRPVPGEPGEAPERPGMDRQGGMGNPFILRTPGYAPGASQPKPPPSQGGPLPRDDQSSTEGARERSLTSPGLQAPPTMGGGGQGGAQPTLRKPDSPSPMAGSSFVQGAGASAPPIPFAPLPSPSMGSMAAPMSGGLYGRQGGLQGGGLGLPLDPVSNSQSDPITTLIQLLMKGGGGGF